MVKRGEYNEEVVRWADAIISAGGLNFTFDPFLFLQLVCLNQRVERFWSPHEGSGSDCLSCCQVMEPCCLLPVKFLTKTNLCLESTLTQRGETSDYLLIIDQ